MMKRESYLVGFDCRSILDHLDLSLLLTPLIQYLDTRQIILLDITHLRPDDER